MLSGAAIVEAPRLSLRFYAAAMAGDDVPRRPPVTSDGAGILGGDLLAGLERWAAEGRVAEDARARSPLRWLAQQAEEEATFAGALLDLAERRASVVVSTIAGRRHRGTLRAVAADCCALRLTGGADVLLAYTGIAAVRPQGRAEGLGDRAVGLDVRLVDVLTALVAERPRVLVVTGDPTEALRGELRAVGQDVLTLRLDGDPASSALVAVAAVVEIALA
jgi:hypothetical protein